MTAHLEEAVRTLDREHRGIDALNVLDTPREERFDRFVRLAEQIFDVPISAITLIDDERAWFKACVGVEGLVEVPAHDTFCQIPVRLGKQVVVPDATLDPRTASLPSVTAEPHLRFYAGHPLHDGAGRPIGTLCIFDVEPRDFTERQSTVLAELAAWVDSELLRADAAEHATAVQFGLLPKKAPDVPGWDASALWLPTYDVSGDFFDHVQVDTTHLFVLADVMGKGTGAAILSATVRAATRARAKALRGRRADDVEAGAVARLVGEVNEILLPDLEPTGAFVTSFMGRLDEDRGGLLRYVDAGHGLAVLVRADGTSRSLRATDLPMGVTDAWRWTEQTVEVEKGDMIVLLSDGVLELGAGTALDDLEHLWRDLPATRRAQALVARVREIARRKPLVDDVTVLAICRES